MKPVLTHPLPKVRLQLDNIVMQDVHTHLDRNDSSYGITYDGGVAAAVMDFVRVSIRAGKSCHSQCSSMEVLHLSIVVSSVVLSAELWGRKVGRGV
jgi:hypothetical protein